MTHELRCIALKRSNTIRVIICNVLAILIYKVSCIPKINDFYIEFGIQKNILRFNIAVSNSTAMNGSHGRNELAENMASCLLGELLS